ncbi:TetR family transcriptional regulator [Nocardia sp. R7R-8]|uniref:TetR family transcriptional regulator n=1 Tax=Nocardia sp. R7R-8 TaxID=3459304 RepID=UPI00403E150A
MPTTRQSRHAVPPPAPDVVPSRRPERCLDVDLGRRRRPVGSQGGVTTCRCGLAAGAPPGYRRDTTLSHFTVRPYQTLTVWTYHICGLRVPSKLAGSFDTTGRRQGLVPRLVDHEARRRQITDAVRRVIVSGGLEAVTFQTVAAEAGMSIRLVQYYFGTKREFLLATHRSVMADAGARFTRRWTTLGEDAGPRAMIHALLTELLPLDEQRREETIVLGTFGWAAVTGQSITAEETFAAPRALTTIVAGQIERARGADASPERDAALITATIGGLAQGMLQGYGTPEETLDLVDHLLDRVLGTTDGTHQHEPE